MNTEIGIIGLARSLPEGLPLYHYCLGGLGIRIVLLHKERKPFQCDTCDIGRLNINPSIYYPVKIIMDRIRKLIGSWKPCFLFLDGIEPSETSGYSFFQNLEIPVAVRTQGFVDNLPEADAYLVDIFPGMYEGAAAPKVINTIEEMVSNKAFLEAVFYTRTLRIAAFAPFLSVLPENTPIHIEYQGVASETKIEEFTKKILKEGYTYVYVRDSERWFRDDTYCPGCKEKIVHRQRGITMWHRVTSESLCGHCGMRVHFKRIPSKEHGQRVLLIKKGIPNEWHPPEMLL